MRILTLIDVYKDGGAEKVLDLFTGFCNKNDYEIFSFCLYGKEQKNNVIPLQENLSSSLLKKVFDQKFSSKKIRKKIMENKIDAVVSFLDRSNLAVIKACSHLKSKPRVTLTVHNPPTLQYKKLNVFIRKLYFIFLKHNYNKKWVKVIAVSETIKQSLNSIGIKNVSVVHNPLILNENKLTESCSINENDFFLAIGRLENQKAYWKLLKSYSLYLKNPLSRKSKLVILGKGSQKEKLKLLSESLGISNNVIFAGYVNNPFPFYKNCKALVFSSLFEGFPVTLVECMSVSKPFIGSEDSIPIEIQNYLAKKNIFCTYKTTNPAEDFCGENFYSDEKSLCNLMMKCDQDNVFIKDISFTGNDWFLRNCSIENFKEYL